jgi:hypothetical protein
MWAKFDDELIDHSKVFVAGEIIGQNGPATALGFYAVGLMWSNKHLSDGFLPIAVVRSFRHVDDPLSVADALVKAGLWETNGGSGFQIHDFHDHNPRASKVKAKRKADKIRKQQERDAKDLAEKKRG